MTVSPYYQQRNEANPYYTVDITVEQMVAGEVNIGKKNLRYRNIEKEGDLKFIGKKTGKFLFQIYDGDNPQKEYISIKKDLVTGHFGMKTRKDTTASSNVNEILSVFFLINEYKPEDFVRQVEDDSCTKGLLGTGVLNPRKGVSTEVTYQDLCELLDKDETAERDIKIGYANAIAIKKDLPSGSSVDRVYWCPRGKPPGVAEKNPSDTVVELENGDYIGYSNKIAAGKDQTPKFNTNLFAFYGKRNNREQIVAAKSMMDTAWLDTVKSIPETLRLKPTLASFDIVSEPYSESGSKKTFGQFAKLFRDEKLNFYGADFYHKFRNNLINNLGNHLKEEGKKTKKNLEYFLKTVYFYTYGDPDSKELNPCPYKLLIGREDLDSTIKDVSDNENLKEILLACDMDLKNIKFIYDGKSQSFTITFSWKKNKVSMPITCRTRATGGWSGKSLFITTSGLKVS